MERIILHVDMDAFFASVEIIDKPYLRGKPVVVGGTSERGVVATCSYEARKYGVRSAMPTYMAKIACPTAIFLPTRHERYEEVSNEVFKILYSVTDKVEGVSIDEAYLDVTGVDKNPVDIAKAIKNRIKIQLGLTISVGISYNKFLSKLASDWEKPDGLKIITREMVPKILFPLPINKVHGLGDKSVKKLNNIGIFTIEELYKLPKEYFHEYFGKFGNEIYERIRGEDNREINTIRNRKSIGRETTLKINTKDKEILKKYICCFSEEIEEYLRIGNIKGKTITLKIKTASFRNHSKSKTLINYILSKDEIYEEGCRILESIELNEEIRLIGLSISTLLKCEIEQLSLF